MTSDQANAALLNKLRREIHAAIAMHGLLLSGAFSVAAGKENQIAQAAFKQADAMMKIGGDLIPEEAQK